MVENRWQPSVAESCTTLLAQRVYSSRLLGEDPELVMHGGGNTSVKALATNLFGEVEDILHVKGSGWDLATIEGPGLPALRLAPLRRLRQLSTLTDMEMVNQLRSQLLDARAPDPSVEALLHAFLPHRFIDHTHADAILTLTNQPGGERIIRDLYGERVGIVPYIMPGFRLAKVCADIYEQNPDVIGLILLKHGVFSFGDSAQESYARMLELVGMAEARIASASMASTCTASVFGSGASSNSKFNSTAAPFTAVLSQTCAQEAPPMVDHASRAWWAHTLRSELARRKWRCCCLIDASAPSLDFVAHPELERRSQCGPMTPDHVIRTKSLPLLLSAATVASRDLAGIALALDLYAQRYHDYFVRCSSQCASPLTMLDVFPRVVLLPGIGVATVASTTKDARIALDIYRHTMGVISNAERSSAYEALAERDLFEMEYWVLEQAKLKLAPKRLPLTGKTVVVSGGANGIGLAIAKEMLSAGGNVAIFDINQQACTLRRSELGKLCRSGNSVSCERVDVTKRSEVSEAMLRVISETGGIDVVVVNAGIFPPSANIEDIADSQWQRALDVNCSGAFHLIAESMPWLKRQPTGGDIVLIASKNVPAPGKQAGAYSVSKAAQTQLARVCALEGGAFGIRVNTLHPHLILDTDIWTPEVIAARAAAYGMTIDEYRTNNLLKTEITSQDVARSAVALVSGSFDKTTGAQICVDGGSDRTL
jgi:rhamnose utilization protein RhaD (predicted bifunctional aldolase and dehydrogenase)/NAD(P)-dependent dehydrogenase (short-subunit alcohol dehydrogenase family)